MAPLTEAIESVLDRLHDAFRQQRDFTSDAAHELKTSVAIVKSSLQSLLQQPRPVEEYQAGLADMLEDCGRLEDLLARMLRLARIEQVAENGGPRTFGTTELTSTCEAAISRMQALARQRNIDLELVNPTAVHLHADPEDLELIWVNLLENAVQYSPAGSKVTVRIDRDAAASGARLGRGFRPGDPAGGIALHFREIPARRSFAGASDGRIRSGAGHLQGAGDGAWAGASRPRTGRAPGRGFACSSRRRPASSLTAFPRRRFSLRSAFPH